MATIDQAMFIGDFIIIRGEGYDYYYDDVPVIDGSCGCMEFEQIPFVGGDSEILRGTPLIKSEFDVEPFLDKHRVPVSVMDLFIMEDVHVGRADFFKSSEDKVRSFTSRFDEVMNKLTLSVLLLNLDPTGMMDVYFSQGFFAQDVGYDEGGGIFNEIFNGEWSGLPIGW